ncbi:response regulator transcription factor [Pedobacter sp. ASV28]|uniref:response regulator transcription factor n=1 Tax=Pedobacter sp. ASV28 TaxID=2795123 RepID=UPI0018EBBAF3|nr:helix-turn-helix transcriptional regulator [Pedobacter sp. ASV28]
MTIQINEEQLQNTISPREIEVLQLISMGYSNKEIANELFISKLTVETHRRNMVKKMGFRNAYQLVVWAFKERVFA